MRLLRNKKELVVVSYQYDFVGKKSLVLLVKGRLQTLEEPQEILEYLSPRELEIYLCGYLQCQNDIERGDLKAVGEILGAGSLLN